MTTEDAAIGQRVRDARSRAIMSQSELAENMRHVGYRWSQSTVWCLEEGRRSLPAREVPNLCGVLDVNPLWLLGIDDPEGDERRETARAAIRLIEEGINLIEEDR